MRQSLEDQKHIVLVSAGISGTMGQPQYWAAYRRKPNGSLQRIKTTFLPIRKTREAAQADLDAYADKKGWEAREEEPC